MKKRNYFPKNLPEFPAQAMTDHVGALARIAHFASQAHDVANGRLWIDEPNMQARAIAFEADFLLHAQKMIPGIVLDPVVRKSLELYPDGMESLPKAFRYTPMTRQLSVSEMFPGR